MTEREKGYLKVTLEARLHHLYTNYDALDQNEQDEIEIVKDILKRLEDKTLQRELEERVKDLESDNDRLHHDLTQALGYGDCGSHY